MAGWSRRKGVEFERWTAQQLRESCCRGNPGLALAPNGGLPERVLEFARGQGIDVRCLHFLAQCKSGKKIRPLPLLMDELLEATKDAPGVPLLVTKRDRKPALVTLEAEQFFKLVGGL